MEYGIATVMEQYESKYKARQLLGPISEDSFTTPVNVSSNIQASGLSPSVSSAHGSDMGKKILQF